MAISYTWNVSTVDTYPTKDSKSDVVHNVHWRLTATDDSNTVKDMDDLVHVSSKRGGYDCLDRPEFL